MAPINAMVGLVTGVVNAIKGLFNHSNKDAEDWLQKLQTTSSTAGGITIGGKRIVVDFSAGNNAEGGIISGKQLSWVGEEGPEAIIPLTKPGRARTVMAQGGLMGGGGRASQSDSLDFSVKLRPRAGRCRTGVAGRRPLMRRPAR
jgi:hypothetical protein